MFAPEIPGHAYRAKHRGTPRRCDACGDPETVHANTSDRMFFDAGGRWPRPAPRVVRGRHKRPGPVLEGP